MRAGSDQGSWLQVRLSDLCLGPAGVQTGPFGSQLHHSDYQAQGTPIVTVEHLGDNRILHANLPRVSEEDRSRLARYSLRTGDIVVSRVGSVDRRALVHESEEGWLFSGRCLRIRPDPAKINPDYLSWFLGTPRVRSMLRRIAFGATMPSLNTKLLSDILVVVPPMRCQEWATRILRALDDKIDSNRRLSASLNDLVMTVFRQMVKAKTGTTKPLTGLANFVNGRAFTQFANGLGRPILRIAELNGKVDAGTLRSSIEADRDNIATPDDILFSWSGSLGIYRWHGEEALINQHIFKVIPKGVPAWLVYCHLVEALPFFRSTAADKATTMGHIQRRHLDEWKVPMPSSGNLEATGLIAGAAYALVHVLARQSRCIAELRDLLLPKLVSGDPDAEVERLLLLSAT